MSYDAVLVYDGDCPYCSIAASALRKVDDLGSISWYDDAAQAAVAAQFEARPFAMFLFDARRGRVYAGRSAAEELADRAGMPRLASRLVRSNYDGIAKAVGLASGRGRDPDDYHDIYPMDESVPFDELAAAATGAPLVDA